MKTDNGVKAGEFLGQVSGKAVDTFGVWAEANQRVLRELVDLSVGAAKEGVRLYAELQHGAVEAVRDSQATAMKWQANWQEGAKDPMEWLQKTLVGTVDNAQKFCGWLEGNAQAVTRSAERMQASADQAGKGMQETFETTLARMKDTYTKN